MLWLLCARCRARVGTTVSCARSSDRVVSLISCARPNGVSGGARCSTHIHVTAAHSTRRRALRRAGGRGVRSALSPPLARAARPLRPCAAPISPHSGLRSGISTWHPRGYERTYCGTLLILHDKRSELNDSPTTLNCSRSKHEGVQCSAWDPVRGPVHVYFTDRHACTACGCARIQHERRLQHA